MQNVFSQHVACKRRWAAPATVNKYIAFFTAEIGGNKAGRVFLIAEKVG
jgi:hypothetical protein